jgi:hypothetical protein
MFMVSINHRATAMISTLRLMAKVHVAERSGLSVD